MNLELVQKVLEVSEAQPFDFAKLRGRSIAREGEEMESAGLVVLSAAQSDDPNLVVIKGVTAAGRRLLRVLRDKRTASRLKRAIHATGMPSIDLELVVL
jgi:hypothetical protein